MACHLSQFLCAESGDVLLDLSTGKDAEVKDLAEGPHCHHHHVTAVDRKTFDKIANRQKPENVFRLTRLTPQEYVCRFPGFALHVMVIDAAAAAPSWFNFIGDPGR